MICVIDSNILISALIKDSVTRRIIVKSECKFYYPEIAFHEVRKYQNLVLEKSGMSEEEYAEILNLLLNHITLVPEEIFLKNINEAKKIIGEVDINDVVFLATAMSINNSKIWSDDKDFDKQNKIEILKTKDMIKLFCS